MPYKIRIEVTGESVGFIEFESDEFVLEESHRWPLETKAKRAAALKAGVHPPMNKCIATLKMTGGAVTRRVGALPSVVLIGSDEGYSWLAVNGVIEECGHGIDRLTLLKAAGVSCKSATVDEAWLEECCGSTPDKLEDFKLTYDKEI